jgi:leucyl/phenylalanyl-tRNA--protein transferase
MTQRFDAEVLLTCYARGVFPMAQSREDPSLFLLDPDERGIMPLDGLHISKSLRKSLRRNDYRIAFNQDFPATVTACAEPGPGREDTWINPMIEQLYADLHARGHAHSVELRDPQTDALMGGLYGVSLGGAFFGESMFSRRTNASKIALVHLVERLSARGFTLLDMQFLTPHLAMLGGIEIPRDDYQARLHDALKIETTFN